MERNSATPDNQAFRNRPFHTGQLLAHNGISSRFIPTHKLSVWLPPDYAENSYAHYPVIYAHDGQNLFEAVSAFGGVDWGLAETLARLAASGEIRSAIVVGIWNTTARRQEYFPQRVFDQCMSAEEQRVSEQEFGRPMSDLYLRFIVSELKPFIDAQFRTQPGRENTFIMGSSMGGLVSAYALCEFPRVFSAAACLSTHWPACNGKMVDYLRDHLPVPGSHRFYFDFGTLSTDLFYEPYQRWVDDVLRKAGFCGGQSTWLSRLLALVGCSARQDFVTRKFKGQEHSERAWRQRVEIPLKFLLAEP